MFPCPSPVRGLNDDWDTTKVDNMKKFVNDLTTDGGTNQPVGLVWAWQSLRGGGPLAAQPKLPNTEYKEYVILLSDGLNTGNRWNCDGVTDCPAANVDARMYGAGGAGTCKHIKDGGIVIYTVQVNTANPADAESALLKNCATDTSKFYRLTDAGSIPGTFDQIVRDIAKLYVAR